MIWIVIVGHGSWAKCYGTFATYDAAIAWVRANQFDLDDVETYPVNEIESDKKPVPFGMR